MSIVQLIQSSDVSSGSRVYNEQSNSFPKYGEQCGFKMFTRAAARRLFTNINLKRWCFDAELVYLCKRLNIPMVEISVNWSEILGPKVNLLHIPNMFLELALMLVRYRTGMWKIRHA